MALTSVFEIRPKINLDVVREIVLHNQKAYRYRHAKKASDDYIRSYAQFVAAQKGCYYDENDSEHPYMHVSKLHISSFIHGQSAQLGEKFMTYGIPQTQYDLRQVYDEIQQDLDSYISASENVPDLLSHAAKQFLIEHPEYEDCYQIDLPSFSTPEEKEAMEQFDAYFREANHLHKWLVDHIQNGKDDYNLYLIHPDQLLRLKLTLTDVVRLHEKHADKYKNVPIEIEEKLQKLLPTQKGRGYGSMCYKNKYYLQTNKALGVINAALEHVDFSKYSMIYSSTT